MVMSIQEIVKSYTDALDKGKQIGVLADLNVCSKQQIITVLQGQGITSIPTGAKRGRKPKSLNTVQEHKATKPAVEPKHDPTYDGYITQGITQIESQIEFLEGKINRLKQKRDLLKQALEVKE